MKIAGGLVPIAALKDGVWKAVALHANRAP